MTSKWRRIINGSGLAVLFLVFYMAGYANSNIANILKHDDHIDRISFLEKETVAQRTEIERLKTQARMHDEGVQAIQDLQNEVADLRREIYHYHLELGEK